MARERKYLADSHRIVGESLHRARRDRGLIEDKIEDTGLLGLSFLDDYAGETVKFRKGLAYATVRSLLRLGVAGGAILGEQQKVRQKAISQPQATPFGFSCLGMELNVSVDSTDLYIKVSSENLDQRRTEYSIDHGIDERDISRSSNYALVELVAALFDLDHLPSDVMFGDETDGQLSNVQLSEIHRASPDPDVPQKVELRQDEPIKVSLDPTPELSPVITVNSPVSVEVSPDPGWPNSERPKVAFNLLLAAAAIATVFAVGLSIHDRWFEDQWGELPATSTGSLSRNQNEFALTYSPVLVASDGQELNDLGGLLGDRLGNQLAEALSGDGKDPVVLPNRLDSAPGLSIADQRRWAEDIAEQLDLDLVLVPELVDPGDDEPQFRVSMLVSERSITEAPELAGFYPRVLSVPIQREAFQTQQGTEVEGALEQATALGQALGNFVV